MDSVGQRQSKSQLKRREVFAKNDLRKITRPMRARDNISGDFAGYENRGPSAHKKTKAEGGTNVKSRNLKSRNDDRQGKN